MIHVTKPALPSLQEYNAYLNDIWSSGHLTNGGQLASRLEAQLGSFLQSPHVQFVSNGTTALQLSIRALELSGEVITTPFSFVATVSSLVWEKCEPVFADIDPATLCIDPQMVERAVTKRTTAILACHVFGNPCDVERLGDIAKRHGLKLIYDAAHAFGVRYKETPVCNFGDASILSFHSTKLFHTVEGGAVVCGNDALAQKIGLLRNFGYDPNDTYRIRCLGTNAKNTEFHAAMGLCLLPKVPDLIARRKVLTGLYDELLLRRAPALSKPRIREGTDHNYAYYTVLFLSEALLLKALAALEARKIFPRRYFYPALNTLDYVKKSPMPAAEDVSRRVLCLPIYNDLAEDDVRTIAETVLKALVP